MVLAIFKRNNPRDKWLLMAISPTLQEAQKFSKLIMQQAKKIGLEKAEITIQSFGSTADVPDTLSKANPDKILLN